MVTLDPPDACQFLDCHPGIATACLPVGPVTDLPGGGQAADYECPCGAAWTTEFDRFGWEIARTAAQVAEAEAA